MFGYLRFILSLMVLISHTQWMILGLNIGVVAVVVFYILAGFVFSSLYHRLFIQYKNPLLRLLKDRWVRVYPLYFYALCLCVIFVFVSDHQVIFTFQALLAHLLIVPLNYYMFFDWNIVQQPKSILNPLVWSLASELQAYVLLALSIAFPFLKWVLFVCSFVIFLFAMCQMIDTDIYGYRLVVGVFFIFLFGMMIERSVNEPTHKFLSLLAVFLIGIICFILVQKVFYIMVLKPYAREVLVGILCGIPLIFALAHVSFKLPCDSFLGSLSYAIFLTHMPIMGILDFMGIQNESSLFYVLLVSVLSIMLGMIGIFCVERPLHRYWR